MSVVGISVGGAILSDGGVATSVERGKLHATIIIRLINKEMETLANLIFISLSLVYVNYMSKELKYEKYNCPITPKMRPNSL